MRGESHRSGLSQTHPVMCRPHIWPIEALGSSLWAGRLWLRVSNQDLLAKTSEGSVDLGAGVMEGVSLFVALLCGGKKGHMVVFCPLNSMLELDDLTGRTMSPLTLHLRYFSWDCLSTIEALFCSPNSRGQVFSLGVVQGLKPPCCF